MTISERRGLRAYDAVDPDLEPGIRDEIDMIARADGIVFVIDSQEARSEACLDAYAKMTRDLKLRGLAADAKPTIFQANKRDLPQIRPMEWIRANFHAATSGYVESTATDHKGTVEALRELLRLTGALAETAVD